MQRDSVTYRLGTSGEREVLDTLARIAEAGEGGARRLGQAYTRDLRLAETSIERLQRRAEALKVLGGSAVQRRIAESTGLAAGELGAGKSAEASMAVFIRQQDELARSRDRLLAQADPLAAAQQRYNATMAEAVRLDRAGALAAGELSRVHATARAELDRAAAGHADVTKAVGAHTMGIQQLGFQASDFAVQMAGGTSAVRAFALQGPQMVQALVLMGQEAGATKGKFAAFTNFLAGPWGAAITVGVSVVGLLATSLLDADAAADTATNSTFDFSEGLDVLTLSADEARRAMEQLVEETRAAIAVQGDFLQSNALIAGQSVKDLERRIGTNQSWLTGFDQDSGGLLANVLPSAFGPSAWERNKARRVREQIAADQAALRLAREAQTNSQLAIAQQEVIEARDPRARAQGEYRRAVGRLQKDFELSRDDPIAASNAGVFITEEGYKAELNRLMSLKEAAEEVARADERRGGGRSRSGGRGGTRAEREAEAEARGLDQALRSLTSAYDPLAAAEAKRAEQLAQILQLERAGVLGPERAGFFRDKAREDFFNTAFAAEIEAANRAEEDATAERERQAQLVADYARDQSAANRMLAEEGRLLGASADERERALSRLGFILELERQELDVTDERVQALIRGNDELVEQGMALTRANRLLDEQRRIGENIVDTLFDPSNWDDWGETGKRVLQMLVQEMLILAAVNPLKNELFGSDLPVLGGGGIFGFLGGLFGGGGGPADLLAGTPFGNASGTEWSSGGWRRVGEFGEELVRLPRGAQVMNAGRTRQADRAGAAIGGHSSIEIRLGPGLEGEILRKSAGQTVKILEATRPGMLRSASAVARRDAARPRTPGGTTG